MNGTGTEQGRDRDGTGMEQNQNGIKTSELELSGLSSIPIPSQPRACSGIVCSVRYCINQINVKFLKLTYFRGIKFSVIYYKHFENDYFFLNCLLVSDIKTSVS